MVPGSNDLSRVRIIGGEKDFILKRPKNTLKKRYRKDFYLIWLKQRWAFTPVLFFGA